MGAQNRRHGHRYALIGRLTKSGRASWSPIVGKKLVRPITVNDVSFTGMSFVIDGDIAPSIGERVALEFHLSKDEQIAWFGEVMRLERQETRNESGQENGHEVLVGVKFQQLPINVQKHIENKLQKSSRSGEAQVADIFPTTEKTIYVEVKSDPLTRTDWLVRIGTFIIFCLAIYGATKFAQQIIDISHDPKKRIMWPIKPEKNN